MKLDDLKELDVQDLIDNLQSLDFENIGSWPPVVKGAIAALVCVLVIVLGYMFSIQSLNEQLSRLQSEEKSLMKEYEDKAFKARNLDQYRQQLEEMEESFGSLLEQLPKDTEVPGLLEDITHTGLGSGLEFEEISLGTEVEREFYAELPINIKVTGDYHGFGSFVSGVAALPRIVTLHDFEIAPAGKGPDASGLLAMTITAKTYRYASRGEAGAGGGASGNQ